MARKLFSKDIPFINEVINQPEMIQGMLQDKVIDVNNYFDYLDVYVSDDGLDIALFEKKDMRLYCGHNCFRSKGRTAINNGIDILKKLFHDNPSLIMVYGLTPVKNKTTCWFNNKIGFKFIKYEWLQADLFAKRYEIDRDTINKLYNK